MTEGTKMTFAKGLGLLAVVAASTLSGCVIRMQQPIKEVAYDFSDRDFYDRAYAPSPSYEPAGTIAPLRQRAEDVAFSINAGKAAKSGMRVPSSAAASVVTPSAEGLEVGPAEVEAIPAD
jgi:hypothetical protein